MSKRTTIKLNLSRVREQITTLLKDETVNDLERLGRLESMAEEYKQLKTDFDKATNAAIDALDDTTADFAEKAELLIKEITNISDISYQVDGWVRTMQRQVSTEEKKVLAAVPRPNDRESSNSSAQPKLEKIAVPTFDGNILNFRNFRSLFENLVHNNENLTNVQKLYYLKQALIGDAKDFVRDFKLEDNSYAEAWAHLLSRFDNKRAVIKALFRNLYNLESIKNESQIRGLLDKVEVTIRGLKASDEVIDGTFSKFITYIVASKLDQRTAKDWDNSIESIDSHPNFTQLQKFLQIRSFNVEDRSSENNSSVKTSNAKPVTAEKKSLLTGANNVKVKCVVCNDNHFLNQCKVFVGKTAGERFELIKKHRLCVKCFNPFHTVSDCKRPNCRHCNGNHHTMLHRENNASHQSTNTNNPFKPAPSVDATNTPTIAESQPIANNAKSSMSAVASTHKTMFLSTAVVRVRTETGTIPARVLLDPGSETTLIRREFCDYARFSVRENNNPTLLIGINDDAKELNFKTQFVIQSRVSNFRIAVEAEVIDKIPYTISQNSIRNITSAFPHLKFAESEELSYSEVDIVLGTEYVEFVLEDRRQFFEGICVRDSKFGYVISGSQKPSFFAKQSYCGLTKVDIETQLERFFKIEDINDSVSSKNAETLVEHKLIEDHFEKTYRIEEGRFVLRLPTKPNIIKLSGSYNKAVSMLIKSENRGSALIRTAYREFMLEYEHLGHMRKISNIEATSNSYYIPHHIVTKLTSTTTKHRVVFNASSVDVSGTSLNEQLLVGPTLQPELIDIVMKFRRHRVAFCADIAQMYRQIQIDPRDRKYQRIVWRKEPSDPISHYELNTVTYGTAPASYLATKCLQVVAQSIRESHPDAADVIASDFYMDDLMSGSDTVEKAREIQQIVHSSLLAHGFPLRKYQSNKNEFLDHLDPSLVEKMNLRLFGTDSCIFVLGLIWEPQSDVLRVSLKLETLPQPITKRHMLSDISRIFDVLGMLSPVTIFGKILMQNLWREQLGWNDPLSKELEDNFLSYRKDLENLADYCIPRCYSQLDNVKLRQLIGFCDASPKAYCAVIFLRVVDIHNNVTISFVCARTRVAPLKALTIPRLELQSAVLLATLLNRAAHVLRIDNCNVYGFSDSQIVLCWINHPIEQLKQFVGNRVNNIIQLVGKEHWFYVESAQNPADLATRGLSVRTFLENKLWLNGPTWLSDNLDAHLNVNFNRNSNVPEIRKQKVSFNVINQTSLTHLSNLDKFSSYNKSVNVTAYIYRFYNNLKNNVKTTGPLSIEELRSATNILIQLSQLEAFGKEYHCLVNKLPISKRSPLLALNVFLDKNNIIRVGGRSSSANFSYDTKFPIVLSRKSRIIYLYTLHIHNMYFHASKSFLLNFIKSRFWISGGLLPLVKKIVYKCVRCVRIAASTLNQFMGDLPLERTSIARPFATTGVDLSGAYKVKCTGHRSVKHNKAYIAFFVCFVTRAVHIELVVNLTTESFLCALERFVSRRGLPHTMYSDNATNFVGTSNVLEKSKIMNFATTRSITWKFITPRSPHQGGLWESAVKSGKAYLMKAIGDQVLNIDELNTVLAKVEAILNSRPVAYRQTNSMSEALTPGHFLTGSALFETPIVDDPSIKLDTRYRLLRGIIASFWSSWRSAYLNQLQTRNKWKTPNSNLEIGDVVILKSPNVSVMNWPLGVIVQVHPDPQGLVRVVNVRTADNAILRRSVQQLVKLNL